jgi:acyl-CoA thioesterase-1
MEDNMTCSSPRVFLLSLVSIILASTSLASAQIVAFGHSAARGFVMENEMWPAVLESMLRARGSQVHVINAGNNGETTDRGLARIDSAVPDGTKIVILAYGAGNDGRTQGPISGSADPETNIEAMRNKIRARGIRLIDAIELYRSVARQPGMLLVDGRHLNVEGNRKLAAILVGMVLSRATRTSPNHPFSQRRGVKITSEFGTSRHFLM